VLSTEIGYVLGRAGRRAEALGIVRHLEEASAEVYVDPYFVCIVYQGMGDLDRAFERQGKAYQGRSSFMVSILSEPEWRAVRDDPRYESMVNRLGLFAGLNGAMSSV
jgi:hypothetical protein